MTEKRVYQLTTSDQVIHAFVHHTGVYSMYARIAGRDDVYIPSLIGTRLRDGAVQVNVGEWKHVLVWIDSGLDDGFMVTQTLVEYTSDEWLVPELLYLIHQCQGCHYPPNMCCMQGLNDDDYESAWAMLGENIPDLPYITIE